MFNLAAVTVDDHHPRGCAFWERVVGDELLGKLVVEIGGFEHGAESCAGSFQFQVPSKSI